MKKEKSTLKKVANTVMFVLSSVLLFGCVSSLVKDEKPDEGCKHENVKLLEGYAQSCDTPGLTEGKICMDCETIIVPQQEIAADGHYPMDAGNVVQEASCFENEITEYTCLQCEAKYQMVTSEATGHQFDDEGICECGESNLTDLMFGVCIGTGLTGSGTSPNLVAYGELTHSVELESNKTFGFVIVESDDVNYIAIEPKKTDLVKELEKEGIQYTFLEAEIINDYILRSEFSVPYEKVNTWYLALPVIRSCYSNGYSYQYSSDCFDICNDKYMYQMSAVRAASTMLYMFDVGFDEYDEGALNEQAVQLARNTIDMSVDLACGLASPVFDGSTYVLEEEVTRCEQVGEDIFTTSLGKLPVGTEFEGEGNIWYESVNEKVFAGSIEYGEAALIFTCDVSEEMSEHIYLDYEIESGTASFNVFYYTGAIYVYVDYMDEDTTLKLYYCGKEYTLNIDFIDV